MNWKKMTQLTRKEKIDLVNKLIKHKRGIDVFQEKFDELFGVRPGFSGNGESTYKVFDDIFYDYIIMVAERIGETKEGIEWFIYENDCGAEGMEAGKSGGEMRPIRTAEDYIDFVELFEH